MLVLSRKTGDRIQIGSDITLTVVKVSGGSVRIGIDAPPHVSVIRDELHNAMQRDANETTSALKPQSAHQEHQQPN